MPRWLPSAAASVDLPAPIIPAMPMKMLPNTSGAAPRGCRASGGGVMGGCEAISVCTRAACQPPMTSTPALEPHHPLDLALTRLGDLAGFAQPVGAVRAQLARLSADLDGD